ncbi:hypothetical protein EI53_00302 [Fusobacterium naviforme]|uniref:Uncharacterized protein n=1 Tax=Moryella indoligenes TaxID=371674 RepID=A0AAE3VBC1_9FIRM|nr:hypothetical protein [Moryella indoligenes]PSL11275.1 hypothetical protein EI53_00302 [Fusobacterium naviforme]STO28650.1 Uncharacterised protein [Fusobacterium naviforme]
MRSSRRIRLRSFPAWRSTERKLLLAAGADCVMMREEGCQSSCGAEQKGVLYDPAQAVFGQKAAGIE